MPASSATPDTSSHARGLVCWPYEGGRTPRTVLLEVRPRERPDDGPVTWLLVEREESCLKPPAQSASIRLTYQIIGARTGNRVVGSFSAYYERGSDGSADRISLTSGTVFLDPPNLCGQHVGTYLMNQIVLWAKRWPTAIVAPIKLLSGQADPENKARRNRFYEQFGLVFDYTDQDEKEGQSRPMPAGMLTQVETWSANIREHNVADYLDKAIQTARNFADCEQRLSALATEYTSAGAHPLQWALHVVWCRHGRQAIGVLFILVSLVLVWLKSA